MDVIEKQISDLLDGKCLESDVLCDFTIGDQNEATVAKGVQPAASSDYVPILSKTVTYIVMGILINENNEVLMMQEAKKSCAGQWYLPAGRMEPGETIVEALKREVLEETGLIMEPKTLLAVETASGSWFRFVITGNIIGGTLKTPSQADSESLQAKWIDNLSELSLRANDIIEIVEKARVYHNRSEKEPWHPRILPIETPHSKLLLRIVVCIKQRSSNRVHVLLSDKTQHHLPVCEIYPSRNLHSTLRKFMVEIFGADLSLDSHKPHGILNVEQMCKPEGAHDGLLITILISFRIPLEEVYPIDKYTWTIVSKTVEDKLNVRIRKNMTIPLKVVR